VSAPPAVFVASARAARGGLGVYIPNQLVDFLVAGPSPRTQCLTIQQPAVALSAATQPVYSATELKEASEAAVEARSSPLRLGLVAWMEAAVKRSETQVATMRRLALGFALGAASQANYQG
jgi:hypothetical protein